jgi:hypothetical protein
MPETTEILDNVIWLVNTLDDEALGDIREIPLLEMAKAVSIAPLPAGFASIAQALEKRTRPRYPTSKSLMEKRARQPATKTGAGGVDYDNKTKLVPFNAFRDRYRLDHTRNDRQQRNHPVGPAAPYPTG